MINVQSSKQNHYFIELRPNYSFKGWQRFIFFLFLFLTCLGIGVGFFIVGAKLILPFMGLEFIFVTLAFYLNFKWSQQKEIIYMNDEKVKIEKGRFFKDFEWEENRAFVSLEVTKKSATYQTLSFRSKGKTISLGAFLNNEDKDLLAKRLTEIIRSLNSYLPSS